MAEELKSKGQDVTIDSVEEKEQLQRENPDIDDEIIDNKIYINRFELFAGDLFYDKLY